MSNLYYIAAPLGIALNVILYFLFDNRAADFNLFVAGVLLGQYIQVTVVTHDI